MPTSWPDEVDRIIDGDMTAGLAYVTPAGGSVVTAVAPVGLRDRERGTVGFTTSLGLSKKLERMQRNPRVALTYHAREHGFVDEPGFVLVQGRRIGHAGPRRALPDGGAAAARGAPWGPPRSGSSGTAGCASTTAIAWRWTSARRVTFWPDNECRGEPRVYGEPLPAEAAPRRARPRAAPVRGSTRPRGAARAELPHRLLAFRGADGYPVQVPVEIGAAEQGGLVLDAPPGLLPPGGRRAGLAVARLRAEAHGLATRQFTGWLTVDEESGRVLYAPHTEQGFRAPGNKTLLLLGNGLLAKRGLRKAERSGAIERLRAGAG